MAEIHQKKQWNKYLFWGIIAFLCLITLLFSLIPLEVYQEQWRNTWLNGVVQQCFAVAAIIMLANRFQIRLFQRPQRWLYVLPCMVIAVNNFPFYAYFSGKMQLVTSDGTDFLLFTLHCFSVGLFEECIFRGILFYLLASYFPKNKKGIMQTVVVSSLLFGLAHLWNIFAGANVGATLLQVGYTILTGGLFAFVFIQTKNVLIPAFVHATYNFCGLLFEIPQRGGLGTGVVFDVGTIIVMATVCVIVGAIIVYNLIKYPEDERKILYNRLSVS